MNNPTTAKGPFDHTNEATATAGMPVHNGATIHADRIPMLSPDTFVDACTESCGRGGRIAALAALPIAQAHRSIVAVIAHDAECQLYLLGAHVDSGSYPALTRRLPQAQAFERELFETGGIYPEGHPWLKPLRCHPDLDSAGSGVNKESRPGHVTARSEASVSYPFFVVDGPGIHEVAVGPVHAGIIEPGHFRFQCVGEEVLHLEIHLGYQHRGAEALLVTAPPAKRMIIAESIAGDTVMGHGLAHCMAMEALAQIEVPRRAQAIRAIALELERIANHVGDLGALSGEVAFLPGASYFGRLRGDILNMLMNISGNRFGRGLPAVGGVRFDIPEGMREKLIHDVERVGEDLNPLAKLLFNTPSVISRFERTGILGRNVARDLGVVGPPARASGLDRDVRRDHPTGAYREIPVAVANVHAGDVLARATVRRIEIENSLSFLKEQLALLPAGPLIEPAPALLPRRFSIAMVEGWRGEVLHMALTDASGEVAAYKVVDPSFHNWFGVAMALRGNQISDFPLCNKSFNLSYAGHDL